MSRFGIDSKVYLSELLGSLGNTKVTHFYVKKSANIRNRGKIFQMKIAYLFKFKY
jgi:hypothetical protein